MVGDTQQTALVEEHERLGARLVDFAGWTMPIQYNGILSEHRAVRTAAGLFDLSHMAEFELSGPDAGAALAFALVGDARRLTAGRAHYSMMCAEDGGVLDDLIVYRLEEDRYLVVANAANAATVAGELGSRILDFDCRAVDRSAHTTLIAIQGPRSHDIVSPWCSADLTTLRYYSVAATNVFGIEALVARTGYTGEDGFELFVDWHDGPELWRALLDAGGPDGLLPIGLGARDTLRLEAGMPLYGQELDRTTTPYDAGLGRVVKLSKGAFVGRDALQAASSREPARRLAGLKLNGRGIARQGHRVATPAGEDVGVITSGTASPTLGSSVAMAYLTGRPREAGTPLRVDIRGRSVDAEVVALPFYRREVTP